MYGSPNRFQLGTPVRSDASKTPGMMMNEVPGTARSAMTPSFFGKAHTPQQHQSKQQQQQQQQQQQRAAEKSYFGEDSANNGGMFASPMSGDGLENREGLMNSNYGGDSNISGGFAKNKMIDLATPPHKSSPYMARSTDRRDYLANGSSEDDLLLPPSNSLLSGLPPQTSLSQKDEVMMDREATSSGLRRRQPIRTPGTNQLGLDLGAPRGFDFSSPVVLNSGVGSTRTSGDETGVTAAVQLISVKSPWVTVFGYPAGTGSAILRHFQSFGEVHEHRSDSGNWMHILYGSKVQASRALAQNGQFVAVGDSTIMIGVKPCSDPTLAEITASAASRTLSSSNFEQRMKESYQVKQPDSLKRVPRRATSVCKRFMSWLFDVNLEEPKR